MCNWLKLVSRNHTWFSLLHVMYLTPDFPEGKWYVGCSSGAMTLCSVISLTYFHRWAKMAAIERKNVWILLGKCLNETGVTFHISSKYILEPYIFYPVPHSKLFSHFLLLFIYLLTDAFHNSEYIIKWQNDYRITIWSWHNLNFHPGVLLKR
jgi:hypothetical protein